MSIIKPKGLEGLKGIRDLSKQEYDAFIKNNEALISQHSYDPAYISTLYKNKQFIDKFGIDNFKALPDINQRNELYRDTIIRDAFAETFKGDRDYNSLAAQLDTQGMYDLMNNSNYIGTIERDKRLKRDVEAAKRVGKSYDAAIENPYVDVIGAGFMQIGKTSAAERPYEQDEKYANNDKEIREKLFAETQERREAGISNITDSIYNAMLASDSNGAKSLNQSYNEFDSLATEKSPHYAAFKDSKWLKDYTHEERLKDYAKYQALSEKYGDGIAAQYLDRTIQNRVSEAQDGKWTGNTLKGVFTTLISDLGSNIALFSHLGTSPDKIGIINQGKDPNKPIYNDKGEIIDYEKDDNWFTNPAYWNNVAKYNTFSPTEIRAIEERGGISEDVNVRDYGSTPDFLSWDTVEEGFKQAGHWGAFWIESALAGGAGKAIGFAGKTAMKGLGLSTKAMKAASKVGNITNDVFVTATSGISGAQLEAMGTFDEQMQSAREKIQDQIQQELHDYYESIDYNSPESKAAINNYYQQLKKQDQRRQVSNKMEGSTSLPHSDEFLMEQAKRQYTHDLLSAEQSRLEEVHKKDELEAAKAATKAYGTNFFMDWVKNAPFDVAIQKFKFAKGSMKGVFDNTINDNIIGDAVTGGVKRTGKRLTSAKNVAKEIGKQLGGGFADEYLDGINASFAGGVGNNDFDNYIRKTYNPETYNAATESMLGNMLAGFSEGIDGITDRGNLYEGFIGMLAPTTSVMVNPNSIYNPKDTWKAIVEGVDAKGNKLNFAERMSYAIMNPLLSTYADLAQNDKAIDSTVDAINKVVSANKDKLQDASKIISVLNSYDSPLVRTTFNLGENEGQAIEAPTLLDSKDNKLYNAFTLIDVLQSLGSIEGGANSTLYQETMSTLEGLANGTLSSEEQENEVDKFLADENNKSILDNPNARKIAAEKLQENAKYLMDMKAKMEDIYSAFAKSTAMKDVDPRVKNILAYNLVAEDDYKKRLSILEEELSLSPTNTEEGYSPNYAVRYGTLESMKRAVSARKREEEKLFNKSNELYSKIEEAKETVASLKNSLKNTSDGNKIAEIQKKIDEQQNLISSMSFHRKSLLEKKNILEDERLDIEEIQRNFAEETVLREEDILSLDARDRAEVLDSENANRYSKKQQKIIDRTRKKLQKNDPEALQKIKDAGILAQRIEDINTAYDRLLNNHNLASEYLSAVEQMRDTSAMAESLQKGIDEHYSKIEKAYTNRFVKKPRKVEQRQEEFKNAVLATSEDVLEAYMEDHPEQVDQVRPYYEMLQFENDIASIIKQSEAPVTEKIAQLRTIADLEKRANSRAELQTLIEGIIDSPDIADDVKAQYENLLFEVELLGYQRDATIIESRKQRKEREEAAKKKAEEDRIKVEAEAKAAAEKAKVEAEEKKNRANKERTKEDYENAEISNLEDVDLEEEQEGSASNTPMKLSDLLKDDIQEGSVNTGTLWYNNNSKNPKKGDLIVSKKRGKGLYGASQQLTFSVNNTPQAISIAPSDWVFSTDDPNGVTKEAASVMGITKETPFQVKSLEKINGIWYFNAIFADNKNPGTIKVSDSFDIDKTIAQEKTLREAQYASQGANTSNEYINNDGDTVSGKSPSLDEQVALVQGDSDNPMEVVDSTSVVNSNPSNEESVSTLSGNAMSEWQSEPLEEDGVLKRKKGDSPKDSMNRYFKWMDAAGIKLQNIIDDELAPILAKTPHAKVKFMAVRPQPNATNDVDMKTHLMLVLDYDNSINKDITHIHDESNGGVVESKGKKYLIIGVAGYGNKNNKEKQLLYNVLFSNNPNTGNGYGLVKKGMGQFFRDNPSERFYIPDNLSTEIVSNSLIPGYIVRQLESDNSPVFRSIKELLNDEERNPHQLDIHTLAWGIQEREKFLFIRTSSDSVMVPRNPQENVGRVFALVPASNGKLVPAFIKPLFYVEMKNGELKDKIDSLLANVVSPDYTIRYNAIIELSKIFYFDSSKDDILTMRTRNIVSLVHNGNITKTFTLDSNFDRQEFLRAFMELNPRINVTHNVLTNSILFQQYDEAGALTTDCAKLGTAGSSYSVYGVNANGEMMSTELLNNDSFVGGASDGFKNPSSQIVYKHNFYREKEGNFYLEGKLVTDETTIKDLQYNKVIVDGKLSPITSNGIWDYYILDTGEIPKAVKVNKNTKEVKEATQEQARELIDKFQKEDNRIERDKAAKRELIASQDNLSVQNLEDVDLDLSAEVSPESIELRNVEDVDLGIDLGSTNEEEKGEEESPAKQQRQADSSHKNERQLNNGNMQGGTQTFKDLINSKAHRVQIIQLIKRKWPEAPTKMTDLTAFLRKKAIDMDTIGTSESAIQSWVNTIENCRN